jgi:hypothetical protein
VFEILKNQRRRRVLQYLREHGGPVSLSDLCEHIAAQENVTEVHRLSSSERKRVYVGLYQCHLPEMDGMDIVEFNKPRGIIEPGANADLFDKYVDTDQEADDPPGTATTLPCPPSVSSCSSSPSWPSRRRTSR